MKLKSCSLEIDVRAYEWQCRLCGKIEPAYFYHGDLTLYPELVRDRQVFQMVSAPGLITHWMCDPDLYETFNQCVEAEQKLKGEVLEAGRKTLRLTIVGPCQSALPLRAYFFFIGAELGWPRLPDAKPDGKIIQIDAVEMENLLHQKLKTPVPPTRLEGGEIC